MKNYETEAEEAVDKMMEKICAVDSEEHAIRGLSIAFDCIAATMLEVVGPDGLLNMVNAVIKESFDQPSH